MSEPSTILVIGDPEDLCSVYLGWLARKNEIRVVVLDEARLGLDWSFCYADPQPGFGEISVGSLEIPFAMVDGAIVRLTPQPEVPPAFGLGRCERAQFISERRGAIRSLIQHLPCPVANPTLAGRSNGSKPYQMRILERAGFRVPAWIATSDPASARRFLQKNPDCVYKSCSGARSRVRRVDGALIDRLANGTTPVVIQRRIAGFDVRVHTVGADCFSTKIAGDGVDYRFESESNCFRSIEISSSLAALCSRVASHEGLRVAGFDFRVDAAGQWWCLEVNPVPTFLPYEMETGQSIGNAILEAFEPSASNTRTECERTNGEGGR